MDLAFVCKYPPLVGGVSTKTYWKLQFLASAGFNVHVVTNASDASEQHRYLLYPLPASTKNLHLHYLETSKKLHYIPYSNPFITRLASIASEIVENHDCKIIEGNYFEPNAMVASMVSGWTNIPYGIQHAGSDIGSLYDDNELQAAYKSMIDNADFLLFSRTAAIKALDKPWDADHLFEPYHFLPVSDHYHPNVAPLDINAQLKKLEQIAAHNFENLDIYRTFAKKQFDTDLPNIGVYGKASLYKGHMELISALGKVAKLGHEFNFTVVMQGHRNYLQKIKNAIIENGLAEKTFLLPFLPCWQMPAFIRSCTAVCYLENNFPIENHASTIPAEVLTCGRHLIVSNDIAKNFYLHDSPLAKYISIVNLDDDSLFTSICDIFSKKQAYEATALECHEKVMLPQQRDKKFHSTMLTSFYERIVKHVHLKHHTKKLLAIKQYLTEHQANTSDINAELEQANSEIAKAFIEKVFSTTRKIAPEDFDTALTDYFTQNSQHKKHTSMLTIAEAFAEYFSTNISSTDTTHALCIDLMTCELISYRLRYTSTTTIEPKIDISNLNLTHTPYLTNTARTCKLQTNINLINHLRATEAPEVGEYQPKEQLYLLNFSASHDKFFAYDINQATQELILAIDGKRNLAEILQKYNNHNNDKIEIDTIIPAVKHLHEHQLISFK